MAKLVHISAAENTHGCTNYLISEFVNQLNDDTWLAKVVKVQSCHSCWQVGHDADYNFAEVGQLIHCFNVKPIKNEDGFISSISYTSDSFAFAPKRLHLYSIWISKPHYNDAEYVFLCFIYASKPEDALSQFESSIHFTDNIQNKPFSIAVVGKGCNPNIHGALHKHYSIGENNNERSSQD